MQKKKTTKVMEGDLEPHVQLHFLSMRLERTHTCYDHSYAADADSLRHADSDCNTVGDGNAAGAGVCIGADSAGNGVADFDSGHGYILAHDYCNMASGSHSDVTAHVRNDHAAYADTDFDAGIDY